MFQHLGLGECLAHKDSRCLRAWCWTRLVMVHSILQSHIYTSTQTAIQRYTPLLFLKILSMCNEIYPLSTPSLHITLYQCIIKLAPLQPLLVVSPGWCRHAAVGVQQDPEAPDQQEDQEEHEEAYKGQGGALLIVHPNQSQRGAAAATARATGEWGAGRGQQQLVVKCGHIVHPPRGPKAGLTHWLDGWCIGRWWGEGREGVHEEWCRRKGQTGDWEFDYEA